MGFKDSVPTGGMAHFIGRLVIRSIQMIMAVVVVGLYGVHLDAERKEGKPLTPSFLYAVVIGAVSAVTTAIYGIPMIRSRILFAWDALLFIFWIAVFGTFAHLFLNRSDDAKDKFENTDTERMKHAIWVDLVNVCLWLATAAYGGFCFMRERRAAKAAPAMVEVEQV